MTLEYFLRMEQLCERQVEHEVCVRGWKSNCGFRCDTFVFIFPYSIVFSLQRAPPVLSISLDYIRANCGRVCQSPGVDATEVCDVLWTGFLYKLRFAVIP